MKRFTARLLSSVIRNIFAIIIIALGLWGGNMALHWQTWCPNNDFGLILVFAMYIEVGISIFGGIYLVSPIYIGTFVYFLIDEILERVVIDREYEDDYYDEEEDIHEKVKRLRKNYLW